MPSQLSEGSIEAMTTGKNVVKPILQILGFKRIWNSTMDCYRVMVSDGIHCHPFSILGTQLDPMVANNELEDFTVIRLEKFVCNKVNENKNVFVILEVTIIQTAQEAGRIIGNPVPYNLRNSSEARTSEIPCQLSAGAIEAITNGGHVEKPILQILGSKKISYNTMDRYRIMVSDGIHCHAFAMLGTKLNPMMVNNKLENSTIIRLDRFFCNNIQDRNILVLLEVTVIQSAQEAGGIIGNPVTYILPNSSEATTPGVPCQLSAGAVEAMTTGTPVAKPILQILGSKKISNNAIDRYRIMVSDGIHYHAYAMLGSQLNPMAVNYELENFTIIRLEKFVCSRVQEDMNILVVLGVTVLQTAREAGSKIGNPVIYHVPNSRKRQRTALNQSNMNIRQTPPAC